ncbi:MAG TPA: transcription antitermination factor NusB [Caulobacteraceae bacterium]|nr:transcription antitermination factor NusB [Caulobacteraceae bacterium]
MSAVAQSETLNGEAQAGEGLAARRAALELLMAALERRAGMDEALARPAFVKLDRRERAFARALVMLTLRRLGQIDAALRDKLQKPPPEAVTAILRLGAAQLYFMDAPDFAVVNTSVELAGERKDARPFKGLVNAVLRGLARGGPPVEDASLLAPDWLLARWRAAFGQAAADKIAAQIPHEPLTDLSLRDPAEGPALSETLSAVALPGGALRSNLKGDIAEWPGFETGVWWVQDAAAQVPARLLAAAAGRCALDLCAAPGGKTLQLAAAGAAVTALDRSATRLGRVRENLQRAKLEAELIAADAATWPDAREFDAVLLDAPCSATGTFRRHPDVLWAARPGDIAKLAEVQARLLDSAARRVAPGGALVYCVCSLEPEEGEGQIGPFLRRHPGFRLAPIAPGEGGAPAASITPDGFARILPFHMEGGCDGFFAVRLIRDIDPPVSSQTDP